LAAVLQFSGIHRLAVRCATFQTCSAPVLSFVLLVLAFKTHTAFKTLKVISRLIPLRDWSSAGSSWRGRQFKRNVTRISYRMSGTEEGVREEILSPNHLYGVAGLDVIGTQFPSVAQPLTLGTTDRASTLK